MPRLPDDMFDDQDAQERRSKMHAVDTDDYWWRVRLAEAWPGLATYAVVRRWCNAEIAGAFRELDELVPGWRDPPP
jgi:hypothetical protein